MKNKNSIWIIKSILLGMMLIISITQLASAKETLIELEDTYLTDKLGYSEIMNIRNFLYSAEIGFINGKVVYDSSFDKIVLDNFASVFSSNTYDYEAYKELNVSNDDFVIYFGDVNSSFIDEKIKNFISDEDIGVVLYQYSKDIEKLYVVLIDKSFLLNVTIGLEFYEDFYIEPVFDVAGNIIKTKFGAFAGNFALINKNAGFYSYEYGSCDPKKERDSGVGGDYPERYGCLNNGVDWMCDTCADDKALVEFYCENNVSLMRTYKCSSCNYGACVPECVTGWVDEYQCQKSILGTYTLQKAYNIKTYSGKCVKQWKSYKSCGRFGCDIKKGTCLTQVTSQLTGRVVSESGVNIFSRLANFFRNLFS